MVSQHNILIIFQRGPRGADSFSKRTTNSSAVSMVSIVSTGSAGFKVFRRFHSFRSRTEVALSRRFYPWASNTESAESAVLLRGPA